MSSIRKNAKKKPQNNFKNVGADIIRPNKKAPAFAGAFLFAFPWGKVDFYLQANKKTDEGKPIYKNLPILHLSGFSLILIQPNLAEQKI